jgi:hypothetical protein
MFSKVLSCAAVVSRVVGYGTIVLMSLRRAAAEAPCYVMILAAEALQVAAVLLLWFSKPTCPPKEPAPTATQE